MKTLFIETSMGASGDMLLGSLLGLLPDAEEFLQRLNRLGFEGLTVERKVKTSMGIAGNRIKVRFYGQSEEQDHHKDEWDHPHSSERHCRCDKTSDPSNEKMQEEAQKESEHALHPTFEKEKTMPLDISVKKTSSKCCGHFEMHEDGSKTCCRHSHHKNEEHETADSDQTAAFAAENDETPLYAKSEKKHYKHKKEKHRDHHKEHSHKTLNKENRCKCHHEEHHTCNDLATLGKMIDTLDVDADVKTQAKEIYQILAEAEAIAHNKPSSQIHFHELGEKDAVFDIVAVCLAIKELGAQKIYATPIHVGYGKVKTAHGKLPVPTPATAEILKGIPIYSKDIQGELCTPTGAALLKYFVHEFCSMPPAIWERIGYGIGSKEFKEPNILRTFFGESEEMKN